MRARKRCKYTGRPRRASNYVLKKINTNVFSEKKILFTFSNVFIAMCGGRVRHRVNRGKKSRVRGDARFSRRRVFSNRALKRVLCYPRIRRATLRLSPAAFSYDWRALSVLYWIDRCTRLVDTSGLLQITWKKKWKIVHTNPGTRGLRTTGWLKISVPGIPDRRMTKDFHQIFSQRVSPRPIDYYPCPAHGSPVTTALKMQPSTAWSHCTYVYIITSINR